MISLRGLGLLLVACGLLVNPWSAAFLLGPGGEIHSRLAWAAVLAVQALCLGTGLLLATKRPAWRVPATLLALPVLGLTAVGAYGSTQVLRMRMARTPPAAGVDPALASSVRDVVAGERRLLDLEARVQQLGRSVSNLAVPDALARPLFAPSVVVVESAPSPDVEHLKLGAASVVLQRFGPGPAATRANAEVQIWEELLGRFQEVQRARFHIVDWDRSGTDPEATVMTVEVLGRLHTGEAASLTGRVTTGWDKAADPAKARIVSWRPGTLDLRKAAGLWFTDVSASAIPDLDVRRAVQRAPLDELLANRVESEPLTPDAYASLVQGSPRNHMASRGVSVVDVDGDGFDDLFVAEDEGPSVLLHNQGDGTFVNRAAPLGLDFGTRTSAALFADFDNDGDPDVFVGSWSRRARFLANEGGRFVDRTEDAVDGPLPRFVSAFSAADYDGDGLLDLYITTYGYDERLMTPEELAAVKKLEAKPRHLLDLVDVPNLLLHNLGGGRFAPAGPPDSPWGIFRRSYQGVWSDYDRDGDADLYVVNDYGPNNLLRNDRGTLVDATDPATADVGFGMGADWGDYDEDGWPDLYVSNMDSNAGRRITRDMPGVDGRFVKGARGNSLLRNVHGTFQKVSGTGEKDVQVERAGWAFAAQFWDPNLDGRLDLYVPNGYFTQPDHPSMALVHDY